MRCTLTGQINWKKRQNVSILCPKFILPRILKVCVFFHSTSEKGQNQLNISDPLELSGRRDLEHRLMTQPLLSTHTTKASCPPSSHSHNLHFQDSIFELSSSSKGSATQKPSDHNKNESTQLETTSSPSLTDSQQKDPNAARIPQSDWMWHNGEPLSAVVHSATPKFPIPHCDGEVTAPSKYGYSQGSSVSPRKLTGELLACMQYPDIHRWPLRIWILILKFYSLQFSLALFKMFTLVKVFFLHS